ncbi:MAG: hypothetical protein GIW94_11020 [Candidatus Eremiobacteraeota bacterium]|nr:hypothetical protein [Candidatus Eremiobacteraeota bacterium]
MGASLGNRAIWVNSKSTGAIERIFSAQLGESLFGSVSIRYGLTASALHARCDGDDQASSGRSYVGLQADGPGTVEIHPAYQRRAMSIAGSIDVTETLFVPLGAATTPHADAPTAHVRITLANRGASTQHVRVSGFARLRGSLPANVCARYDQRLGALVAWNEGMPAAVRVFGSNRQPTRYATTVDFGSAYDPTHLHALAGASDDHGDILGSLQFDLTLEPGASDAFTLTCAAYATGEHEALRSYEHLSSADDALTATIAYLEDIAKIAQVLTPNRHINEGALWSKVNMRRVMSDYPQGRAFTNEPGVSSNVVGRDAAWFVYGNDHFMPGFSRALLDKLAQVQYPDGKIPECYNAIDGSVADDGLNINDDTPLFILAVNHHFRASGDLDWLRRIYPAVARAARYIVSVTDDRGLVWCTAHDPRGNVWAIASWRNVIDRYTINGAVTEINAECAAALRAVAHLAENVARDSAEIEEFSAASRRIGDAMNFHLRNPENGLYYLNIDVDGNVHTDVTGDQVFPVMFRVCDEETGFRIISRLNAPDFWTSAGLRTVSRNDPLYDPSGNIGLLGGVWPGLTWWYAFAAARYHPEFMVTALGASFQHYAADPKKNNTVPGQFGEYFDGESLINRGMRLSPWEPPRFLWAAVEGVCGLMLTTGLPRINPLVPANWKWVALRNLPYHGRSLSYFATRERGTFRIYATGVVESDFASEVYDEDVSDSVSVFSDTAAVVALRREDGIVLLIANVGGRTANVPVSIGPLLNASATYDLRMYNSEHDAWEAGTLGSGGDFGAIAVSVESEGYRLVELRPQNAMPLDGVPMKPTVGREKSPVIA